MAFHLLTAVFTLFSLPLLIPFFELLFEHGGAKISKTGSSLQSYLQYYSYQMIEAIGRETALIMMILVVVFIFFLRNVFRFLASYYIIPMRNGVIYELRQGIFDACQTMSLSERNRLHKGQTLSLLSNDLVEIDHGILKSMELLCRSPLIVIGSLIFMFWIDVKLSLVALGLATIVVFVVGRLSRLLKLTSSEIQHGLGEIQHLTEEYIEGYKTIKGFGADEFFSQRFNRLNKEQLRLNNRILRRRDLASPLVEFLAVCIISVLLWYGAMQVLNTSMAPASFFTFIFAFYTIIDPAKSLSREFYHVQKSLTAWERIDQFVLQYKVTGTADIKNPRETVITFNDRLTMSDVCYKYENTDTDTLTDINLTIAKGEKIGVVGISGMGKTTLLDILVGLIKPQSGSIMIDDMVVDTSSEAYKSLFGLSTQDRHIFSMSYDENVSFSEQALTSEERMLLQVFDRNSLNADQDQLHHKGAQLSGGENQRIALVRALYHAREILLLDEPTNAMDLVTESKMLDILLEKFEEKTIVMVTHHLPILKKMNKIIVLHDSRIVQQGTFTTLLEEPGIFMDLYKIYN